MFFFSSRRRHTRLQGDWSSDVCSSDLAGGFTTYLDRSWDVTLRDSTVLRGELERYRDEITSDGSVGDIRLAAASRLSRRLAIGARIHILAGSTRMTAERPGGQPTLPPAGRSAGGGPDRVGR